ncbi:prefoldin subunit alpha [Candidatus Woesearchaeota archaeon]|nr:prefoldin subunit alpha [Candidatus Woesearchaeota archaeon]MBW2978785.1 prefoldin subunit alpha [Candidatus Woesearchaeota archaeon]
MTEKKDINTQELQQKYMKLQTNNQQLQQLQQQLQAVQNQLVEVQTILLALDDIAKTEVGKEMFVPLSSGIFVKAEIKDNKMLKVNVGSNTVVEKSVQDTKALLDRQILDLNKLNDELTSQYAKVVSDAEKLQLELQSLASK